MRHGKTFMPLGHIICILLVLMGTPMTGSAMEIADGRLRIPTAEITLIWEHYCMKHMANNEWHLARLNKKAIEFQRANKEFWGTDANQIGHFQKLLSEAQVAKAKAGESWKCDPPPAKIAFTKLRVGQCGDEKIPRSFISNTDATVETEAHVGLIDNNCKSPKIEWIIVSPKYDLSKTAKKEFETGGEDEPVWVASSGLSDDETLYACMVEEKGEKKKMGSFEAAMASIRCGYITYEINKIVSNLVSSFRQLLSIPKALMGDRGDDFKVSVGAKLFCNGKLSDNIIASVGQDEQDQLRQEYLDMGKQTLPERKDLTSDLKTKNFSINQFNKSQKVNGEKYKYVLCRILDKLENVKEQSKVERMIINSGYRNPYKNARVSGSGRESQHIYGYAADIDVRDFNGDGVRSKDDWDVLAEAAKNDGACVEPYRITGTWVHMDWRGTCPNGW